MLMKRRLGPQLYISGKFPYRIRFGLFPVRSLLLRESRLVSFPPPTKMFPFRGFPLPSGSITSSEELVIRSLIRVSSVLQLHALTRGVSLLAAPFVGVQAWPFPRRRSVSGLLVWVDICLTLRSQLDIRANAIGLCMVFIASEKSSLHPSSFDCEIKDCILDGAFYGVIFIANFISRRSLQI